MSFIGVVFDVDKGCICHHCFFFFFLFVRVAVFCLVFSLLILLYDKLNSSTLFIINTHSLNSLNGILSNAVKPVCIITYLGISRAFLYIRSKPIQ